MPRPDWIEVGRVRRSHGLQGEVLVSVDSDNPDRFRPGAVVYGRARRPGPLPAQQRPEAADRAPVGAVSVEATGAEGRRALEMVSVREGTRGCLLVAFAGVVDRNAADALRGWVLEIPSADLPELEEGEFYPFDLAGLQARDERGRVLGTVIKLFDTPAQSVLSIRLEGGGEALVPFIMESVPVVDVAGGFLVVAEDFLEQEPL